MRKINQQNREYLKSLNICPIKPHTHIFYLCKTRCRDVKRQDKQARLMQKAEIWMTQIYEETWEQRSAFGKECLISLEPAILLQLQIYTPKSLMESQCQRQVGGRLEVRFCTSTWQTLLSQNRDCAENSCYFNGASDP